MVIESLEFVLTDVGGMDHSIYGVLLNHGPDMWAVRYAWPSIKAARWVRMSEPAKE